MLWEQHDIHVKPGTAYYISNLPKNTGLVIPDMARRSHHWSSEQKTEGSLVLR